MDAVYDLARNAVDARYEDLPAPAIQASKNDILDILGTAIAGAAAPGCRETVATLLATYANPQACILLSGHKVPAPEAAFANATLAHALDFDDTHDKALLHAGVSVVPAALAVAEQLGAVTGRQLITAVTLGLDWVCRMGLATKVAPIASGWMYTSTYGYFGGTAASGILMGLDVEQMVNAMGIAYAQAAGNTQCMADGALTKRMQPGFAARGGVLSALLAKNGITGAHNVLEGAAGLYHVYLKDAYDRAALLAELGKRFEGVNLSFKPYPSCRYTHTAIDATLNLLREHRIDADAVASITVGVNQHAYQNVCMPLAVKTRPVSVVDAQFSIPYCVATALVKKDVLIQDFAEREMRNPRVLALAQKVRPLVDAEIEARHAGQMSPALVSITLQDGRTLCARKDAPRGSPEDPMSFGELVEKFRRCADECGGRLPAAGIEAAIDMVRNLESLSDVRELMNALACNPI